MPRQLLLLLLAVPILAISLRCSGSPVQVRGDDRPRQPAQQQTQPADDTDDDQAAETED